MLLNISNHPSSFWSARQRALAESDYHGVMDIPFPQVDPDAETSEVEQQADQLIKLVLETRNRVNILAIHLMGEMTLTVALLKRLQAIGFPVLCSTTRRNVLEEENGNKVSRFEFVKFRIYPTLLQ